MSTNTIRLPPDLAADMDTFEGEIRRFLAGEMPPTVFKARRVPRGIYEQRRDGTYMLRVRVTGGVLSSAQAQELAALSQTFGNGLLHITTRQDLQFHDVGIQDTPAMMRRLLGVGLTSKGGGGNTVRNVTTCPHAGICRAECFDVTACAQAVTDYLVPLVGSYNLPRKYKIAFSGCAADCALAQLADLGFLAALRDGQPGFRVMAGGGLGASSRTAETLLEWVPASEILRVAEALRRLFDQLGDRTSKHRARLRYVLERLGIEEFRRRFAEHREAAVRDGVPAWEGRPAIPPDAATRPATPPRPETRAGVRVIAQPQAGYVAVPLHTPLGFVPAADLARIGALTAQYSAEAGMRATRRQNLVIRFVREDDLPALVAELRTLSTDLLTPNPLERFVACAGAATCRLGICLARNAAAACAAQLARDQIAPDALDALEFHLNGCANACGQQPAGMIGGFGVTQRAGERLVPSYMLTLGGRCGPEGARLGVAVGKVPAAALPACLSAVSGDFASHRRTDEPFPAYLDRRGLPYFEQIVVQHAAIPDLATHPEFAQDLQAAEDFSLAGRSAGECSAGVFEVIQHDLAAARKATAPFDILLPATRALLITRGIDAQDPDTVLHAFDQHFIETGLVAAEFRALLALAHRHTQGTITALDGQEALIARLRERVELLYTTLDANLVFHPPAAAPAAGASAARAPSAATPVAELNLAGVTCPMNFVKAKLKLETMHAGEDLAIILDDGEPIRSVPASFRSEGQEVGEPVNLGNGQWRVQVCKRRS
jgi:sulfite reductase (ferredoxin)